MLTSNSDSLGPTRIQLLEGSGESMFLHRVLIGFTWIARLHVGLSCKGVERRLYGLHTALRSHFNGHFLSLGDIAHSPYLEAE